MTPLSLHHTWMSHISPYRLDKRQMSWWISLNTRFSSNHPNTTSWLGLQEDGRAFDADRNFFPFISLCLLQWSHLSEVETAFKELFGSQG